MPTIIVAAGLGAALIPRSVSQLAQARVTYHRPGRSPLRAEIAMVTRLDHHSPLIDAFTRHARQAAGHPGRCRERPVPAQGR